MNEYMGNFRIVTGLCPRVSWLMTDNRLRRGFRPPFSGIVIITVLFLFLFVIITHCYPIAIITIIPILTLISS